jgi:phosphoglycerol transferase
VPDVRNPGRARQLAVDASLVAVAAVGILAVVYRLWDASLTVPFEYLPPDRSPYAYGPDAPFYLMLAKAAIDHGWFLSNPSLGYPFGQALHEFPQSLDNLNLAVLQVLGWVTQNPFAAVNLFFVLTFVGVSVSAFLVARRLGCSRLAAAVVALLFTFLPYHFARGTPHLLLSAYWLVPVAALLIVQVVSERPPFTAAAETPRGWRWAWRSRSSVLWILACVGLASTGSYYAALTMTLLAIVVGVDFVARRDRRALASGALAIALVFGAAVVNLIPTFVYWAEHGRNGELVRRGTSETEVNGLKVSQLVLPVEGHRVHALADAQADSTRFTVVTAERGQQLGAIGAIGFLAIVVVLLASALRRRAPAADDAHRAARVGWDPPMAPLATVRVFGVATVGGILVAAVSGFSLIVSGLGLKEIRSWNRISVVIGFFALVTVGFGIDWLRRRLPDRPWRTPVTVAALALLLVVGILDQFAPRMTPRYADTEATFNSDRTFFRRVERSLPDGSAVFNLPYLYFPESGTVQGVGPYDTVRGYLQTDDLRWSWGGVVGTDADWVAGTAQSPPATLLDRAVAMGFRGLVVDRRGYENGFKEYAIGQLAGPAAFLSPDGTLAFYDLRDYAKDARRRLGPDGLRRVRAEALRDRGIPKARG